MLQEEYPSICSAEDGDCIDENCDRSAAKHTAQWWTRPIHTLKCSHVYSVVFLNHGRIFPPLQMLWSDEIVSAKVTDYLY